MIAIELRKRTSMQPRRRSGGGGGRPQRGHLDFQKRWRGWQKRRIDGTDQIVVGRIAAARCAALADGPPLGQSFVRVVKLVDRSSAFNFSVFATTPVVYTVQTTFLMLATRTRACTRVRPIPATQGCFPLCLEQFVPSQEMVDHITRLDILRILD